MADVLYLMKRQRFENFRIFNFDFKALTDKIKIFVEADSFPQYSLTSIYSSMCTLGIDSYDVGNLLFKRLSDETHPDYNKFITLPNIIEIITGVSQKGYYLSLQDRRIIVAAIKKLDKSYDKAF